MKAALFKVNSHKVCSKYELGNKVAYFVFITQMHIYIYKSNDININSTEKLTL